MIQCGFLVWTGLCLVGASLSLFAQSPASASVAPSPQDLQSAVNKYCVACHNQTARTGGLSLEKLDLTQPGDHADTWEKVIRKVRVGMMPPQGLPRPDQATQHALVSYLQTNLDKYASAKPNPGRPLLHRLNRTEYANAIRDLLSLDVDPETLLPPDDSAYGFDNIADALGASPVLLDRYLSAAEKVSALAVGDPQIGATTETYRVRQDASQDVHIEGLPLGTVGGILVEPTLPLDGEYVLKVNLLRTNLGVMRGLEYPHTLEISIDGKQVRSASFGGESDFKVSLQSMTAAGDAVDARFTVRMPLTAGPHKIGVAFIQEDAPESSLRLQPFIRASSTYDPSGYPHVDIVTLAGPFNPTGPGNTPSRAKIFVCRPTTNAQEEECARRILTALARRAYRGQNSSNDLDRLMEFYRSGRRSGNFDSGIQTALARMLASPKFLIRVERDPANAAPGSTYRLSDFELASRLSFFLWSTIPDDQLLDLAAKGSLKDPAVLERQVRRMMADPKAQALIENFAGQWLYLRNLRRMVPNSMDFPDFDDNLRTSFERETQLFFDSIIREDRNVLDLMTAKYTFVNERLAKHYGIPNVYGSNFRRIELTDEARWGLLGKGSVLMVSSHTDRTSPVVRGKWVLENLLGTPAPPMPANVPPLSESNSKGGHVLTMRERMEEHRANPVCASCHKIMDPIGFSMENFDAIGAWRMREGGTKGSPIDASGQLMDGTKVNGVVELRRALMREPEIFVQTVTEKLMTYGLGRGVAAPDMPMVRAIVRDSARDDYRFSALVLRIIRSPQFQMRITAPSSEGDPVRTASR